MKRSRIDWFVAGALMAALTATGCTSSGNAGANPNGGTEPPAAKAAPAARPAAQPAAAKAPAAPAGSVAKAPAAAPAAPAGDGKGLFLTLKCTVCHAVSGAGITGGKKGPDLTGVGKRHPTDWMAAFLKKEIKNNDKAHPKLWSGSGTDLAALLAWLAAQ
ncbi:MAG: c-type cytochrome [Planctomycetes bacterium]|nr:c-type cytochrome [Planctomycetota bacterium]